MHICAVNAHLCILIYLERLCQTKKRPAGGAGLADFPMRRGRSEQGASLKTLSICMRGACSDIWSLSQFRWRKIGLHGSKLRYLTPAQLFLLCETGSFGKRLIRPFINTMTSLRLLAELEIGFPTVQLQRRRGCLMELLFKAEGFSFYPIEPCRFQQDHDEHDNERTDGGEGGVKGPSHGNHLAKDG